MSDLNRITPSPGGAAIRRRWALPRLRALEYQAYRRLLAASVVLAFGQWMTRLAVGWLVLDVSGSVFLTALSFAAPQALTMLVAPFAGAIADRVDRRHLLFWTAVGRVGIATAFAVVVAGGVEEVWPLLVIAALTGVTQSFSAPAIGALVTDIVGPRDSMNGISLMSVGTRSVGIIGAIAGGVIIHWAGAVPVFAAAAGLYAVGAAGIRTIQMPSGARDQTEGSVVGNTVEGLKMMAGVPTVAALLTMAVLVEILGFSYQALLPSMALNVLDVGAIGLGALMTMAGVGSLLGSIALSALGDFARKGALLLGAAFLYGAILVGFGSSSLFGLSLVLIVGVGVMAAASDALQWTLLQANVPDRMRGRAIGGWVFAISFGFIGHLELGAVGQAAGVQTALVINGSLLAVAAVLAVVLLPKLRRA